MLYHGYITIHQHLCADTKQQSMCFKILYIEGNEKTPLKGCIIMDADILLQITII